MPMELIFLGTSSGTPTRHRNVAGLALRSGGAWDLFDCGEGSQHRIAQTSLRLQRLRRIFISHLNGDHCFGLFGLLASRAMDGAETPVTVIGPTGLEDMVRTVLSRSATYLSYPLEVIEVAETGGRVQEDPTRTVDALPLAHRVTSFAWWIRESDRPGAFDAARAADLGIEPGPEYGRLKAGETITLADGREVHGIDLVGPPQPGRILIIAGDNSDPAGLLARTGPVQVLVHEATFTEDVVAELGDDQGHSTAARVAAAAANAGVGALVLTHFSPRYAPDAAFGAGTPSLPRGTGRTIGEVRDEAQRHFTDGLHIAEDLAEFELSRAGVLQRRDSASGDG